MTEENNYDIIFLNDYFVLNGCLERMTIDLGEFDSLYLAFFDGEIIAEIGMYSYTWSDKTIESGDILRIVCKWNERTVLESYKSPACDALILKHRRLL